MSCNQTIELSLKNPNPLFVQWMEDWLEHADKNNLKTKSVFQKGLVSLKKYPLPLKTGLDCIILEGFGPTICGILDKRLEQHKLELSKKPEPKKKVVPIKVLSQKNKNPVVENPDSILMSPNTFDIILLIDTQETSGKLKRSVDATIQFLEKQKIKFEVRKLQVGDFAWIVRDQSNNELVIPYIVERKRVDDLASSIKDGRFHEQKFRLKQSGIQNLIYLIESHGNNQFTGLPFQTLMQAATNTQVHSKFQVKFTDGHNESMLYLSVLTELFTDIYKNKVIISSPKSDIKPSNIESDFISMMKFDEFNKFSTKSRNFTTRELFVKQLLQLKTLSVEKVLAILKVYPTPRALMDAYENCESVYCGENLLADIKFGVVAKSIGPIISKTLYHLYNNKDPS